jgi:hypothetical protein
MGARQKLNQAVMNGCLIVAGVVGALCRSWLVFGVATAVVIGLAVHGGDIRLRGRRRR